MKYMKVIQDANAYNFETTIDLSMNQKKIIKDVLNNCDIGDHFFLDIKPFLKNQYSLEVSHSNESQLIQQYHNIFVCLTQVVCKTLAKDWIKIICPQKQAQYPYKCNRVPEWWPKAVPHIEPDHLDRESRIKLLIGILRHKSVNLLQLRQLTNLIHFKLNLSSNLNYLSVHRLIYELFYMSLYERWILNYGIFENSELFNELDLDTKFQSYPTLLRISNIGDTLLRCITFNEVNYSTFKLRLKHNSHECESDMETAVTCDDEEYKEPSTSDKFRKAKRERKVKANVKSLRVSKTPKPQLNLGTQLNNAIVHKIGLRPSSIVSTIRSVNEAEKGDTSKREITPDETPKINTTTDDTVGKVSVKVEGIVESEYEDKADNATQPFTPRPIPIKQTSDSHIHLCKREQSTLPSSPSSIVFNEMEKLPIKLEHSDDDFSDFKFHFDTDIFSSSKSTSSFYHLENTLSTSSHFSYSLGKNRTDEFVVDPAYHLQVDYEELLEI